ncbi:hypothetical protein C4K01_0965 [Pseudomonas synxantha]|nr:hypothetical protein C4K01_0965 [Pseudomonas synxantha]
MIDPPPSGASPLPHWISIVGKIQTQQKARLIIDQPGFFIA